MLDSQLIVIDGLSGSGKTTTIKWLAQQLEQRGKNAEYLLSSTRPIRCGGLNIGMDMNITRQILITSLSKHLFNKASSNGEALLSQLKLQSN